ncbi:PilZ domain-containing protein [Alteromonadaceae bacterium Bs31]|nr:PilZ domain-containing protein [Alteromonadaceae bacterium Bs31]
MSGFRKHGRTLVKCAVHMSNHDIGDVVTETRDISETGVFVSCREIVHFISIGDEFRARLYSECDQITDIYLKVVRLTEDGVGLSFA